MKSLVLHVGANKTGSTAIQEFLRLNAGRLPAHGITVAPHDLAPNGRITGQHVWFFEPLLSNIPAGRRKVGRRLDRLMADLPENGRLLISAENLALSSHNARALSPAGINGAHALFSEAARSHHIQIILYIRRQDEFLLSSWQQWEAKTNDSLWAWLLSAAGREGNWCDILQAWEKVVPRKQIMVRLYGRAHMAGGDVIADFAAALGLSEALANLERPAGAVNPSYAEALVDLVKGNAAIFRGPHDNEFYNVVEQLTGDTWHRRPRESMITHEQRCAILDRYRESNEWVRANYFSQSAGPLFPLPSPDDYVVLGKERLEEEKWRIVTSLLYNLSKRVLP